MTTAQGLAVLAATEGTGPRLEPGDLSLALAGAELVDLVGLRAVLLHAGRVLPAASPRIKDAVLFEAASGIVREPPYETVEQWLWRRGRDLAARYWRALQAATADGAPAGSSRHPFRRPRPLTAAPAGGRGIDRRRDGPPVLAALAAAARIAEATDETLAELDPDEAAVVGAVHQAITQLAAERHRRSLGGAGFGTVPRGF
ncbi:GPP34 family phosphoprotein [Streptomyces sp. NPDC004562]|uniref:GPP34 family phosphoprotein n=1 Tax=unclassified Streptomyces TaxID=2593676 RepID=UPI00367AB685